MDQSQVAILFETMRQLAPWSAVLMLLQLFIGERADAARNCTWGWLKHLDSAKNPSESIPQISIPKVNRKTTPRDITLFAPFAALLQDWSTTNPLTADSGQQWPAPGQPTIQPDAPLFPAFKGQGHCWDKAVTERAYAEWFCRAANTIKIARSTASQNGLDHCFVDYPLDRLGTHSMKKQLSLLWQRHLFRGASSALSQALR